MSEKDLLQTILKTLSANRDLRPRLPIHSIVPASRFREDLGFDSLALMSFYYELEEAFPHLSEDMVLGWKSVSDCIRSLQKK